MHACSLGHMLVHQATCMLIQLSPDSPIRWSGTCSSAAVSATTPGAHYQKALTMLTMLFVISVYGNFALFGEHKNSWKS